MEAVAKLVVVMKDVIDLFRTAHIHVFGDKTPCNRCTTPSLKLALVKEYKGQVPSL